MRDYRALESHCTTFFYKPDMEALRIVLAIHAAQFAQQLDSIWCFVIGPSGSGKTAFCINSCLDLPQTCLLGKITPHTFISGFKGAEHSLLYEFPNGTFLFKDFTTILSMRQDARTELFGQIREIADGYWTARGGNHEEKPWTGKISAIAACTYEVEKYWAMHSVMGDRFVQIRWPRLSGPAVAAYSRRQSGHEKDIASEMRRLAKQLFQGDSIIPPAPPLSEDQSTRLDHLAEIVAYTRGHVSRDVSGNSRDIKDSPQIEQTGRLGKAIPAIVRYHAALLRKPVCDEEDIQVGVRVAMDCIPYTRSRIMACIPPKDEIGATDILRMSGLTKSALDWTGDELVALGVLDRCETGIETTYKLTDHLKEMWGIAFPEEA